MKYIVHFIILIITVHSYGQQVNIARVDEMPDFPEPYVMRDWKVITMKYDSLVFNLQASGTYMPLMTIVQNTYNYPEHPTFGIQSYVGTNSPPGMEAINVIASVVGASLVGIDKSDQFGHNWALYCEEYFNRRPAENVYLNGPNTSSGNDWWYETMPNVFFLQLNSFYPHTGDFDYQVLTLAERWLQAVEVMGGFSAPWSVPYMNYRAFSLSSMTPLETGVKQPEAAGAIGWILYQAYTITGNDRYRVGSEWCMEFLHSWDANPSYELQMPYGAYTAARMNAELGTFYDVEKMVNWCFDRNDQRGWGVIVGNWGGVDMSGLIGEVNASAPDYVFHMNSLEQLGALVPMVRYDDRFAGAIAKWALNVANASRFYYSAFLPDDMQDNEEWTVIYDTASVIAYESLREKTSGPFGTGDAMNGGWAHTNLGLYGSSHVGIFGAIIHETDVEGILMLDLLATDYYRQEAFPSYLVYNPFDVEQVVNIELPAEMHDIYDAVSNQVVLENVSASFSLQIQPLSTLSLVFIPAGSMIEYDLNRAYVGETIIDYNTGENVENYPPRIKSLALTDTVVLAGYVAPVYCTAEDHEPGQLEYQWWINGENIEGAAVLDWPVPDSTGLAEIISKVTDEGGLQDTDTIYIPIVEKIKIPPEISGFKAGSRILYPGASTSVTCEAIDANGDSLSYSWSASSGTINGTESSVQYTAPGNVANVYIVCVVTDTDSLSAKDSLLVLVRDPGSGQTGDLVAWYPFDGDAIDATGNGHDGSLLQINFVQDQHGKSSSAINLYSSGSQVRVDNQDDLNFKNGLSVCMWLNVNQHYDREAYPVSHGNWTTRWKISIGNKKLRFTINGSQGIIDLDSWAGLETGEWYHVAAVYNGVECLLFINGELDAFHPFEGQINTTPYDLVFGQSLPDQSGFNYNGKMDNVRIYNYGIPYEKVKEIYEEELSSIEGPGEDSPPFKVFPNPAKRVVNFQFTVDHLQKVSIKIYDIYGRKVMEVMDDIMPAGEHMVRFDTGQLPPGIYFCNMTFAGKRHNNTVSLPGVSSVVKLVRIL